MFSWLSKHEKKDPIVLQFVVDGLNKNCTSQNWNRSKNIDLLIQW